MAVKEALHIIKKEAEHFIDWHKSNHLVDFIKQYRNSVEAVKRQLEVKALNAIKQEANINDVFAEFSHKLTNKLIHALTQTLLQAATHNCDDCFKI